MIWELFLIFVGVYFIGISIYRMVVNRNTNKTQDWVFESIAVVIGLVLLNRGRSELYPTPVPTAIMGAMRRFRH